MSYTSINVTYHGISKLKEIRPWQESWNLNAITPVMNTYICSKYCILSLINFVKILHWYIQCLFIPLESKMAIKIIKTKPKSKRSSKICCKTHHIQSSSLHTIMGGGMCTYGLKTSETHQNNDKN